MGFLDWLLGKGGEVCDGDPRLAESIVLAVLTVVLATIIANKTLSPQYVLWLGGPVAALLLLRRSEWLRRHLNVLSVKESGAHLSKVFFASLIAASDHVLDSFSIIHLNFITGLLVNTHMTCWTQETLSEYQSTMLLGCKKEIYTVRCPAYFALSELVSEITFATECADAQHINPF